MSTAARPAALAKHGNGLQRPTTQADRDAEAVLLHTARQLRARYRVSLAGMTTRGVVRALMTLVDQKRLDLSALQGELDARDMREMIRLLTGDTRLTLALRGP
jgi:hypothetical protein